MSANLKPNRPGLVMHASPAHFRRNAAHRAGDIRAVALDGRLVKAGHSVDADAAVQQVIEETFGEERHSLQLEADRKAYEPRNNAVKT